MNMDTDIVVALIALCAGVLSGAISNILTNRAQRRKNNAEAAEALSQAAANLIKPLNKRIDDLEAEVKDLRQRMAKWLDGIKKLIKQIRNLGHEPIWIPQELTAADPPEPKKTN